MPTNHRITGFPPAEVPGGRTTTFPHAEVRILRAQIDLALALIIELMDEAVYPQLPVSGRLKATASAMQLRDALRLIANRAAWDAPPALPPRLFVGVDLLGFLNVCATRPDLPAIIRAAAAELRDANRADVAPETRRVIDLAAYFTASRDIGGLSAKETAQAISEVDEWRGVGWTRIVVAVALHRAAVRLVGSEQ